MKRDHAKGHAKTSSVAGDGAAEASKNKRRRKRSSRGGVSNAEFGIASVPPDVTVVLEEYRAVRQEELAASHSYISTLRYGVTGCVVLIGFAAHQGANGYLGWTVALAVVPLVVLLSSVIWMGEYERMARAGNFAAVLEERLNKKFRSNGWPLSWESWLREGGIAQSRVVGGLHRYITITGVLVSFQVASLTMGAHFYWHHHADDPSRVWIVPLSLAANLGILLTLLGYFRSSYERLRDLTAQPDERKPDVRPRLRIRLRLYVLLAAIGFISVPWPLWLLGIGSVVGLDSLAVFGDVPPYVVAWPALLWMAVIPLLAPRGVMRELLRRRIGREEKLSTQQLQALRRSGALKRLTNWERGRLRAVESNEINAPAIGRGKNVTLTHAALRARDTLRAVLSHEIGHYRLQHLHPLALSYLYLWPYLYYDERAQRMWLGGKPTKLSRLLRALSRVVWTVCALPGWLAWVVLRFGWRIAEYDADRFVFLSGEGEALRIALERRQAQWRSGRLTWREIHDALSVRLRDGRSIGYLPIPNEHPSPRRRLDHLEHLGKAQRIWDTEIWRTARRAALGSVTPIYSEPAESSAGSAKG